MVIISQQQESKTHLLLGGYADFYFFDEAIKLLDYQIQRSARAFNTLNFRAIRNTIRTDFIAKDFFEKKIANSLFYGLNSEFYVIPYSISKGAFGIRNYQYFSYPFLVLYYSVGLYFAKITERIFEHIDKNSKVHIFYGGQIKFVKNSVVKNSNAIHYHSHYKNFKARVKQFSSPIKSKKIVIKLDIQNYYDDINISNLLSFLDLSLKHETKNEFNFNQNSQRQIEFFFKYMMRGNKGVPQNDKNIASDFIGTLYLLKFDFAVEKYFNDQKINFHYVRYVDDIYIIIEQFDNFRNSLNEFVHDMEQILFESLNLRLNVSKTKVYAIDDLESYYLFLSELKNTSVGGKLVSIVSEEEGKGIEEKADDLISALGDIKSIPSRGAFFGRISDTYDIDDDEREKLKYIFEDGIANFLKQSRYKRILIDLFSDFNFGFIAINIEAFLAIVSLFDETKEMLINFLLNTKNRNLQYFEILAELVLLDTDALHNPAIIEVIKNNNSPFANLLAKTLYDPPNEINQKINLYNKSVENISLNNSVIEQIQLRRYNEVIGNYAIALNHLVNEFSTICFDQDINKKIAQKDYKSENILIFLYSKNANTKDVLQIENLFNRRNNNSISHARTDGSEQIAVTMDEYNLYKESVFSVLSSIL